jgi:hypothetical protein
MSDRSIREEMASAVGIFRPHYLTRRSSWDRRIPSLRDSGKIKSAFVGPVREMQRSWRSTGHNLPLSCLTRARFVYQDQTPAG